jgi:hypothetical protein
VNDFTLKIVPSSDPSVRIALHSTEGPARSAAEVKRLAISLAVIPFWLGFTVVKLPAHPLPPRVARERRTEPVPLHPNRLVAEADPALEQQVLDVPQRQWGLHLHHHQEVEHLGEDLMWRNGLAGFRGGIRCVLASHRVSRLSVHLL